MEQEALVVRKFVDVNKPSMEERMGLVQEVQQSTGSAYIDVVDCDHGLEVRLCMTKDCMPNVLVQRVRSEGV